jgi:hypothetical protein
LYDKPNTGPASFVGRPRSRVHKDVHEAHVHVLVPLVHVSSHVGFQGVRRFAAHHPNTIPTMEPRTAPQMPKSCDPAAPRIVAAMNVIIVLST